MVARLDRDDLPLGPPSPVPRRPWVVAVLLLSETPAGADGKLLPAIF
jgi:hypothetical protein